MLSVIVFQVFSSFDKGTLYFKAREASERKEMGLTCASGRHTPTKNSLKKDSEGIRT